MNRNDPNRPYDWQDKLVSSAGCIAIVLCLLILAWGR
jgi:hypothetical protein